MRLILVTFLYVLYFVYAVEDNRIQKVSDEDVVRRIKELTNNGSLPAFFKNLKYPDAVEEAVKDLQNVPLSKEREVRNDFFASKINETLECAKIALKKEDPITGRPVMDPFTPEPLRLEIDIEDFLSTNLNLSNIRIAGQLNFDTVKLTFSNSYLQEKEMLVHLVVFTSDYEGAMKWFGVVNTNGKGTMRIEAKNVLIKSKLQYNSAAPPLAQDYSFIASIGAILISISNMHEDKEINQWLNEFLYKSTYKLLNENMSKLSDLVSPQIIKFVNHRSGNLSMLDFLAMLASFECKH